MDATDVFALAHLDAVAQAALVASGAMSATELLEAAIVRLEATRELNAVIADLFDRGRQQAAALDASGVVRNGGSGPLAGIPFLLKDLGASLAGAPEAMGSRALRTHVATESAWIVDRYLDAGLVVFGKTNTPEWGNHCTTEPSLFGPTVNPWSPSITPGGSSGGSAAAVAAGVVPAASGGDGTGSIRVPASCCGLVGLKPRRGRTSFAPGAGHGLEGLVNEHALTRTVRDSAALLDAVAGAAPGDPYTAPTPKVPFLQAITQAPAAQRILIATASPFPGPTTHPEVVAAVERTGTVLDGLGHVVESGAPTIDTDAVADAIAVLHNVSNAQLHAMATAHLGRERTDTPLRRRHERPRCAARAHIADSAAALRAAGSGTWHDAGLLRRRVRHDRLDVVGECDRLGGDLVAARRHVGRSADRSSADGARRDDPAPARRTARNGCAVGRSVAQYIVCCATSVS